MTELYEKLVEVIEKSPLMKEFPAEEFEAIKNDYKDASDEAIEMAIRDIEQSDAKFLEEGVMAEKEASESVGKLKVLAKQGESLLKKHELEDKNKIQAEQDEKELEQITNKLNNL